MSHIIKLVDTIRDIMLKLKRVEDGGLMTKALEVSTTSFVQVIRSVPMHAGSKEFTWQYHQFWFDKATPEDQEKILGAYLGERIGTAKIIGIYESSEPVR